MESWKRNGGIRLMVFDCCRHWVISLFGIVFSLPVSLAYRFGLPQGIWLGPWGHVDLKKPVDDPST